MSKPVFVIRDDLIRRRAVAAVVEAPIGYKVTISPPSRTLDQNAALWPILEAFAKQLQWPVNGQMTELTADEWKTILSAAFSREYIRVAQGLDGGMVLLGLRTSKMGKARFSEFLEFLHAIASERGVTVYDDHSLVDLETTR